MGKPQSVPKPGFLAQLESFLKRELKSLGVDKVEASELRLQVKAIIQRTCILTCVLQRELTLLFQAHREVFEYLIEDFKTYKPLLSAIKNEYEMMIAYYREHIRQMEPLKVYKYITCKNIPT